MSLLPSSKENVHSLSWLRGLAALMVCFFHIKKYIWKAACPDVFTLLMQQGYLGVYLFFVVSGFVIPYSMHQKGYMLKHFGRYMLKRTVRIEPPFILFIFIMFAWTFAMHHWKGWGKPYLFDLKTLLLNISYLAPFLGVKWISLIFWTLAIEFQFYIFCGLAFRLMCNNPLLRYLLMVLMLAAGEVIPDVLLTLPDHYAYFGIGFMAFLFATDQCKRNEYLLVLVLLLGWLLWKGPVVTVPVVVFTLLVLHYLQRAHPVAAFFGDISYSLYLSHGIAGGAVCIFTASWPNPYVRFLLAAATAVFVAWIYFVAVEKRFLRLSKKIRY